MTGGPQSPEVTELRPGRGVVLAWSLVGAVAVALAVWLAVDTRGHALAVALLVACLAVAAPVASQLLAPRAFTWRLDPHGLLVRRPHRRLMVPWDEVCFARVVTVGGDAALELHLVPASDERGDTGAGTGDVGRPGSAAVHTLRLPLGADVAALHRALAHHLGAWEGDGAARPVPPPSGHP